MDSHGGKDVPEVAPILKVSGTKEGGSQAPVGERPPRDCLRDGALARPSEPIQPVDRGLVEVAGPEFDLVENCGACSSETIAAVSMSVFGFLCRPDVFEDGGFCCKLKCIQEIVVGNVSMEGVLT